MFDYTAESYNHVVERKKEIEDYLNELYYSFDTLSFKDRMLSSQIIENLKTIVGEFDKYIISYQHQAKAALTKQEYVVIQGDTLPSIAQAILGDASKWMRIYTHNQLKDLVLSPGDILEIPEEV